MGLFVPTLPVSSIASPQVTDVFRAPKLVDDRNITILNPADIHSRRSAIVRFLWGKAGFPYTKLPADVLKNVPSPVGRIDNLRQVDTLRISMDAGVKGLAHHFIPKHGNNRLVLLHQGHSDNCTFNDGVGSEPDVGMKKTLKRLVREGYSVLAVYMPGITPEDCRWEHEKLFSLAITGNPLKLFLEPSVVSLNHVVKNYPGYRQISMIGFSGGGWTTTLVAAIDTRISTSIHIAGSIPLYLSWNTSVGEIEQHYERFYRIVGYPDLYLLGSVGKGRKQLQILNRRDDCCFGERQHDSRTAGAPYDVSVRKYEALVRNRLKLLGTGSFVVHIDEQSPRHMISDHALERVIIPALASGGGR